MNIERLFSQDGVDMAILTAEITFYIHRQDRQIPGLRKAYKIALDLLKPHINWYRTEKMARDRPVDQDALRALPFWFSNGTSPRNEYGLRLGSGKTPNAVGPWGFFFYFVTHTPDEFSGCFHLNLPYVHSAHDMKRTLETATRIADVLAYHSGHAGFGIQLDEGEDDPQRDQWCYALCRRCSCVDARDLIGTMEILPESIKGISWITLVNHDLLEVIGSVDSIRQSLGKEFNVSQSKNGVMIVAGADPILGDVNKSENILLYRTVDQLLQPIRTTSHPCIPGFTQDTTLEWIERFD